VFSISVETRAGVTRHHLDCAIDALAIVEGMQKETCLPIAITNRARGRVLTIRELRHLPNLAAPIHRERCFSEIFVRRDFARGSSFGFFTA
jgi:hypothetical protein